MAIAALILAILGILLCWIPYVGWLGVVLALIGVGLGFGSLKKAKGLAIAGLGVGGLALLIGLGIQIKTIMVTKEAVTALKTELAKPENKAAMDALAASAKAEEPASGKLAAPGATPPAAAPEAPTEQPSRLTYDASTLYAEFTKAPPMTILDKFMGKPVDLSGEVGYVGKAGNHNVVQLKTADAKGGIIQFDVKGQVKKGKKIKVACGGIGGWDEKRLMMMTDCSLAK